jgi:endonuclease-3
LLSGPPKRAPLFDSFAFLCGQNRIVTKLPLAERARALCAALRKVYPNAHCELDFTNPLELLIATILSAQCTDVQVNKVTPAVFAKYKTARDYAEADPAALEHDLRAIGLFRAKAKNIRACCRILAEQYGGKVPDTMEALVELPGVGRKTANVVLGNAFGKNVGVVVDTHVARLSARLGLTRHTDPKKIEPVLMKLVPQDDWTLFSHWLIFHGRRRCKAQRPDCPSCEITALCPSCERFMRLYTKKGLRRGGDTEPYRAE